MEKRGDLAFESFEYYSITDTRRQSWEEGDANTITILPGPDDSEDDQEHLSWTITRAGRCGPYTVDTYYDGKGPLHGSHEIYRGELCSRPLVVPCDGECECCERYWCEPPPPCE